MSAFTAPLRPEDVGELIDLTVAGDPQTQTMADLQLRGVAALYNILCERNFAYLADEVGMGKTYQALALAAVVWAEQPQARILFISPREALQRKWCDDYRRFFASNYRRQQQTGDGLGSSWVLRDPLRQAVQFGNLRSWTPTINMPIAVAPFLRHTSFTRPVFVTARDLDDLDELWASTQRRFHGAGLFGVRRPRAMTADNASEKLGLAFATATNAKLADAGGARPYFDLVVIDEAQCLRNPDNQTNRVLFELLRGQVTRWLFMSATPAHGGPGDIPPSSTTTRRPIRRSTRISSTTYPHCNERSGHSWCVGLASTGRPRRSRCARRATARMTRSSGRSTASR